MSYQVNPNLTTLNLPFSGIDDRSLLAISTGLARDRGLTTLNVANNRVGDDGARALASSLCGRAPPTDLLAKYAMLDFQHSYPHFGEDHSLPSLDAYRLPVSSSTLLARADSVGNTPVLSSLSLLGNKIGDIGAVAIAESLRNALLPASDVVTSSTASSAAAGQHEPSSRPRSLSACASACPPLTATPGRACLSELRINSNPIGATGVTALFAALAENRSLTRLDLTGFEFGDLPAFVPTMESTEEIDASGVASKNASAESFGLLDARSYSDGTMQANHVTALVRRRVSRLYHHALSTRDRSQFDACALESSNSNVGSVALDPKSSSSSTAAAKSASESNSILSPLAASMFIALALNSSLTVLDLCKTKLTNKGLIAVRQAYRSMYRHNSLPFSSTRF
jgi:hypothetical protein